jgi:hypothetical protein
VKVTRFDPTSDLLIVDARIWGPGGRSRTPLSLTIDTGSSETVIAPDIVDDLGYSPRDGESITTVRAAIGKEHGYTLRVARFSALGSHSPITRFTSSTSQRATASTGSSGSASCASSTTRSGPTKANTRRTHQSLSPLL